MSKYGFLGNILTRFFGKNTLDRITGSDKTLKEYIDLANSDSMDTAFDNVISNSEYGNPISELFRSLSSYLNSKTGAHLTGAQEEQNVFNAEQAAIERGWSERMSNTQYQRSVADMQAVGLNPALMYGNAGVSAAPSGAAASGSSPSAPAFSLMSMLMQAKQHKEELKTQKDIAEIQAKASKDNAKESADATRYAADSSSESQKYGVDVNAQLKEKELNQRIEEARSKIRLEEEQAKTEEQKRRAIEKSMLLDEANANRINALLPYEKAVMTAETAEKRWAAELDMVEAGLKNSLISNGLVHYIMESYRVNGDVEKIKKDILEMTSKRYEDSDTHLHHMVHGLSSLISDVTSSYLVDPTALLKVPIK